MPNLLYFTVDQINFLIFLNEDLKSNREFLRYTYRFLWIFKKTFLNLIIHKIQYIAWFGSYYGIHPSTGDKWDLGSWRFWVRFSLTKMAGLMLIKFHDKPKCLGPPDISRMTLQLLKCSTHHSASLANTNTNTNTNTNIGFYFPTKIKKYL